MLSSVNVRCRVGCAGWSLPKEMRTEGDESYLEQYARIFNCVEINSSFYRHHQYKTYERWAAAVPKDFQFSVKAPKSITHTTQPFADILARFFDETLGLSTKYEVLLLQFPPKRKFEREELSDLLEGIRKVFKNKVVCEPRHRSWFEPQAMELLRHYSVSVVIADPKATNDAPDLLSVDEGGYLRLHGSPQITLTIR